MSERSKGDVSSSSSTSRINNNIANANRVVVKNPLLSASVTGLSFDDFPNKPLLLPAAPPVVHAPPPQPTNALIAGILQREPKTLVTVGQASTIDDNETLDEINLNASSSDDSAIATIANRYLSAGDANANPLLEPTTNTDSLLSQAASSFGALPSVASNVFSSFSKRIYAGNRESEEQQQQPQLDIQPTYIQQVGQLASQLPPTVAPFYAAPPAIVGEAAPEPPKFYAPTELPNLGSGPSLPPTSVGQNTYRITARKKIYAPIPGLSEQQQQQQPQQPQQPTQTPFQTPPYPAQPAVVAPQVAAPPVQEERKAGSGLFSLTNLVPTGVLQNISGLVQSATGRTTNEPSIQPPTSSLNYNAPNPGYFDINTSSGASNYFAPVPASAPPAGFFVPTEAPPTVGGFFNPLATTAAAEPLPAPPVGGFFNPSAAAVSGGLNPPTVGGFFTPAAAVPTPAAAPPLSAVVQPPAVAQPLTVAQPPLVVAPPAATQTQTFATVDSQSAFAPPSAVPPPLAAPPSAVPPPAAGLTSYRLQKGTRLYKSPLTAQETAPLTDNFGQPTGLIATSAAAAPAAIFNPFGGVASTGVTQFAPSAPTIPGVIASQEVTPSLFSPPSSTAELLPPTGASLLAPQEVQLYPSSSAVISQPTATAQENLEPAQAKEEPSQEVPVLATPPTSAATQGIPLYPNSTDGSTSTAPTQTIFDTSAAKLEPPQAASLFSAPPIGAPTQEVPLFATPSSLFPNSTPGLSQTVLEPSQETLHFAAPATSAAAQGVPLYPNSTDGSTSTACFDTSASNVEPPQAASLFSAPPIGASTQKVPLFATPSSLFPNSTPAGISQPVFEAASVNAKATQEVPLFAAPPTTAAEQEVPLFVAPKASEATQVVSDFSNSTTDTTPGLTHPPTASQTPTATALSQVEPAQEVPLFAATQGTSLFPSTAAETSQAPKVEATQEIPLFAAPPTSAAFQTASLFPSTTSEVAQGLTLFNPETLVPTPQAEQQAEREITAETKEPSTLGPLEVSNLVLDSNQSTPLFVPVPPAEGVPLYPPANAEIHQSNPLLVTEETSTNVGSFFVPGSEATSAALTTQTTTTTYFNPFAQTITTALPQDLLPPPVGFVGSEAQQLFEAQTIEPVLPPETTKVAAASAPPPPTAISCSTTQANPFRRSSETVPHPPVAPSALQSFFTPAGNNSSDFNFFAVPPKEETLQSPVGQFPDLPTQFGIAPPPLAAEPPAATAAEAPVASHALGFDQLISDSQQIPNSNNNVYQNSSVNTFSGYFGGPAEVAAPPPAAQPQQEPPQLQLTGNFFDNFSAGAQGQEDQRIQNFFNNPPLQDQPAAPGELKYDIVHSGLPTKHFEERSQTSVSNLVEPPSSACSEFSSVTKGAALQQPLQQQPELQQAQVQSEQQLEDLQKLYQGELPEEILQQLRMANEKDQALVPATDAVIYTPALLHWFYKRSIDNKFVWTPFSHYDSALLETSLTSDDSDSTCIVPVEGGRYDVNIKERTKTPVFWEGKAIEVRRCSWFYKAVDSKYVPYAEETAAALEAEYKRASETGEWLKKIPLANGEQVTMHGPSVIVHFMPPSNADTWGGTVQSSSRPLVVKRDLNDFKIQQGESQRVDHLLFMVHGIGSACDLKMRNVEEVVDDFRIIAQQLVQSHYKNSTDMGLVGRVEVLPIEWHGHLHSEELGIDEKLKSITLESIPRLRNFTNDTLLDVLFYTSPKYCQKIMNTVADALNEVYLKYRMRHPEFNGGVSLAGHSLGSLILFDLLCHQEPLKESEEENKENPDQLPRKQNLGVEPKQVQLPNNDKMLPKQVSYAMGMGLAGTGQPVINYTQLIFHPKKFFALGSPIGMFVTIRGIDKLGLDFRLPTCPGFYNIFHPFDPVAYRIEALVNPDMKGIRPVLIPHHKGRKRMHLELKETMTRVGADIKQKFMDTFKTTLDSVHFLATVTKVKKEAEESLQKASTSQVFQKNNEDQDESSVATTSTHTRNRSDSESTTNSDPEFIELDFPLGKLNDSKRVDYVLQEAPLEFINEYIFALSSHVCYWASEDTILFVMKEIYSGLGISTDSQVPQQSMIIERPSSRTNSVSQSLLPM